MINGIPTANEKGRDDLEAMGFIFSESEPSQPCHTMMVTINANESVNASSIRCDYCPTADQPDRCNRSDEATLLVIASKIIFLLG